MLRNAIFYISYVNKTTFVEKISFCQVNIFMLFMRSYIYDIALQIYIVTLI